MAGKGRGRSWGRVTEKADLGVGKRAKKAYERERRESVSAHRVFGGVRV